MGLAVGVGLSTAAFVLYLLTLSRTYLGDGIQFAMIAESGGLADFLKPNHMLYPLIPALFYRLWELFGWSSGALLPLQIASAIGGAVAVGLLYTLARRLSGSIAVAAVCAAGFAVSFGIWRYSIDAEAVTLPLVAALVVLLLIFPARPDRRPGPPVTAVAATVAILVYQSLAVVVIVVLVAYLLDTGRPLADRLRASGIFLGGTALLTGLVYVVVAATVFDVRNLSQLLDWQFAMSGTGLWGNPSAGSVVQGGQTMATALVGPMTDASQVAATSAQKLMFLAATLLVVLPLVFALPLLFSRSRRQALVADHGRTIAALIVWGVLFTGFAVYWVPGDVSFFSPALVPWWLLVAVIISRIAVDIPRLGRAALALTAVGVVAIATHSFAIDIVQTRSHDAAYDVAASIGDRTNPGDLVVTTGGDGLFLTIPYFGQRDTFSLFHHLLDVEQPPSPYILAPADEAYGEEAADGERPDKSAVFAALDAHIRDACARGNAIYLVGVDPTVEDAWDTLAVVDLEPADFDRFVTRAAWQEHGVEVREIVAQDPVEGGPAEGCSPQS